jgi:hypothetical protein
MIRILVLMICFIQFFLMFDPIDPPPSLAGRDGFPGRRVGGGSR